MSHHSDFSPFLSWLDCWIFLWVTVFLAKRRNSYGSLSNSVKTSCRGIGEIDLSQTSCCCRGVSCQKPWVTSFFCSAQKCFLLCNTELWGREDAHQISLNFLPPLPSKERVTFRDSLSHRGYEGRAQHPSPGLLADICSRKLLTTSSYWWPPRTYLQEDRGSRLASLLQAFMASLTVAAAAIKDAN